MATDKDTPSLVLPTLKDVMNRPVSATEVYYLLERFATFFIWDFYNFEQPAKVGLLESPTISPHFNVWDMGSCIVGAPKDLYSHARTLRDALVTAEAMAEIVYMRDWTVEFSGFDKMSHAAWGKLQDLGDLNDKHIEVMHFSPTVKDVKLCALRAESKQHRGM